MRGRDFGTNDKPVLTNTSWASELLSIAHSLRELVIEPFRQVVNNWFTSNFPQDLEHTRLIWHKCGEFYQLKVQLSPANSLPHYILEGYYRSCALRLSTAADEDEVWSSIQVYFPQPLDEGLVIYPEDAQTRMLPSYMRGDIIVGDEGFDHAFVIKGIMDNSIRQRLNSQVRKRLLKLWQTLEVGDQLQLNDYSITYQFPSFTDNPWQLFPLIDAMVDVSEALLGQHTQISIKNISLAERCEICHQKDLFDSTWAYCYRCNHAS